MIIAVCSQKGGVGKTTTAQAIATGARAKGKKSLAIDLDAQCNLTYSMGGNSGDVGVYELLTGKATPAQTIQKTTQGDIITASAALSIADTTFTGKERTTALKDAIKPIKGKYDVITIDCPPSLNTLLINALTAADVAIIPVTADIYPLQSLYQLYQTLKAAQNINKGLKIGGVLFTAHDTRTVLARDLTDVIINTCAEWNIPIYDTKIRKSVAVREAQVKRQSLFDYAPKSKPAIDYMQLINEMGI